MMWTLDRALRRVAAAGCRAMSFAMGPVVQKVLSVPEHPEIGIHTRGAVDYLARCHDYHVTRERS